MALVVVGAIIVAILPQDNRSVIVNSLNGVMVTGLAGGVVKIPDGMSIDSMDIKVGTAYTQIWPDGLHSGGFDRKTARNTYFIVSKDTLNGIEIKTPEVSISDLKVEKDWGNFEKIFADVVVSNGQFVDIRTNKLSAPNNRIDSGTYQYADFSKSTNGAVIFNGNNKDKYVFVTITSIDAKG